MYPVVKNWHERIRSRPATGQALLKAQLGDERSIVNCCVLVYYFIRSKQRRTCNGTTCRYYSV